MFIYAIFYTWCVYLVNIDSTFDTSLLFSINSDDEILSILLFCMSLGMYRSLSGSLPHSLNLPTFNAYIYIYIYIYTYTYIYIYICVLIEINECESSPCLNGASCVDNINRYSCSCLVGYTDPECSTGAVVFFRMRGQYKNT